MEVIKIDNNLQYTTVWSFPNRGNWSTHKGDYPGNWSPHVPSNIIQMYSNENDIVLDQFVGSGTTIIEACRLGRIGIGMDINPNAINIALNRTKDIDKKRFRIIKGDAKDLTGIKSNSIDLICTHPPYSNIIKYSKDIENDISLLSEEQFYNAMEFIAKESFRVLKENKFCAILMGDTRKNGFIIPLGFNVMKIFEEQGFRLKEIIIKQQHNCSSTEKWKSISKQKKFYLLAHEYLFIFHKGYICKKI